MANQRCVLDNEANNDELQAIVDKALAFPLRGSHIGGGIHVDMPSTWDGTGNAPPGWTKHAVSVWRLNSASTFLPIPDAVASALQHPQAQARLSGAERGRLNAAIAGRSTVDPEAQGATPKAVRVSMKLQQKDEL